MVYLNEVKDIKKDEWCMLLKKLGLLEKCTTAESVLIKPNFAAGTMADPGSHVISDLSLLSNLIEFLSYINPTARICISESDSTGYGFAFKKFEHLGLPQSLGLTPEILRQIELLDLSRDELIRIENKQFKYFVSVDKQLWISRKFMACDFKISLSNLKTHSVTGYSGACKNLFGCLPHTEKSIFHPYIHKVIHDLNLAIKPDLNIVDAFYGVEQNGPVNGFDINTGYRVLSDDALEADLFASQTAGIKPLTVKYIKYLIITKNLTLPIAGNDTVKKYKKPQLFLRVMNVIGLWFQRSGDSVAEFGHRIHTCPSPFVLLITLARPALLKMFDYEKLRLLKREILK